MRTILSASGPFSIACVAHVDSSLSNVRTSPRRVRTFFVFADLLYVMGEPFSLARGPFSFIGTPSGLFWSLALRVRTILSASGPFSIACVAHVVSILSNVRTSARRVRTPFVLADLFICYGWTSVPRSRTVFIHRDPEWTFLVTRASRADHSPRGDLFLLVA